MTLLIGAGGHAKVIAEILAARGTPVAWYVDPAKSTWLIAEHHISDDDALAADPGEAAMGMGGMSPGALSTRLALMQRYRKAGWTFPPVFHPSAIVSASAVVDEGALVLAGAIVQPNAKIGAGAIVNTGAIVEHDANLGEGAHAGPGAIVLGGVSIGDCTMVGAGSVVLPGADIPAAALVRALNRSSGAKS